MPSSVVATTRSYVSRNRRARRQGFALALTSLMMVFIVSIMGMAVDALVLFSIRGRLSSAANSAALAAVRDVSLGVDIADANAKATESARRFLSAGFPANYLGVDPAHTTISTGFNRSTEAGRPNGELLVSVLAEVAAPVYFMKFWGVTHVPVSVEGKATRRNLVLVVVLDKSAAKPPNAPSRCEAMMFAASQIPDYFSPYDSIGVVSFGQAASIVYPVSTDFKGSGPNSLKALVSRIGCDKEYGRESNRAASLETAYREIQRIDRKLAANAVILVTGEGANVHPARNQAKRMREDPNYRIRFDSIHIRPAGGKRQPAKEPEDAYTRSVDLQELAGVFAAHASALQSLTR